jgi:hypothetical protein
MDFAPMVALAAANAAAAIANPKGAPREGRNKFAQNVTVILSARRKKWGQRLN